MTEERELRIKFDDAIWVSVACGGKTRKGENCGAELTVNLAKQEPGEWAGKQCAICGTSYGEELINGLKSLSSASISIQNSKAKVFFKVRGVDVV